MILKCMEKQAWEKEKLVVYKVNLSPIWKIKTNPRKHNYFCQYTGQYSVQCNLREDIAYVICRYALQSNSYIHIPVKETSIAKKKKRRVATTLGLRVLKSIHYLPYTGVVTPQMFYRYIESSNALLSCKKKKIHTTEVVTSSRIFFFHLSSAYVVVLKEQEQKYSGTRSK